MYSVSFQKILSDLSVTMVTEWNNCMLHHQVVYTSWLSSSQVTYFSCATFLFSRFYFSFFPFVFCARGWVDVDAVWQQVVGHFGVEHGRGIKGKSCHNFDIWGGKKLLLRGGELTDFFSFPPTLECLFIWSFGRLIGLILNDARQITAGWLRYIFSYSTSKLRNSFTANWRKYNWQLEDPYKKFLNTTVLFLELTKYYDNGIKISK
jgi:hypothetical protein